MKLVFQVGGMPPYISWVEEAKVTESVYEGKKEAEQHPEEPHERSVMMTHQSALIIFNTYIKYPNLTGLLWE